MKVERQEVVKWGKESGGEGEGRLLGSGSSGRRKKGC